MALVAAQQDGHQDGHNAAHYEKVVGEPHRLKQPLTLEHASTYPDSYSCIENQKDVDAYNAAFAISYEANRPKRQSRLAKQNIA